MLGILFSQFLFEQMVNLIFNTNFIPEKNTIPCSFKTAVVLDDQSH